MEAKNPSVRPFPAKAKEKRAYGKAPFELDLPQALEAMNKIAQEGKTLPQSKLAIVLGNTVTSSAFSRKVRALAAYGLLADQTGQFVLTDLALAITFPRSPEAQLEAKKQAFLKIEQFSFLFNQHKGKLLPADEFLRNIMEQECSIPREVSDVWVRQFKNSARTAGLFHSRADGKIQIVESPMFAESPVLPQPPQELSEPLEESERTDGEGSHGLVVPRALAPQAPLTISASGHCTRIDLSGGRRAEISIPDKLSPKDADKLKKALQGVAVIIDSMVSDDGS